MAKKKIVISYGRTIQARQYEPVKLSVSIEKVVDDEYVMQETDVSVNGLQQYVDSKLNMIVSKIRAGN